LKRILGLILLALVAYAVFVIAKLPMAVAYQAVGAYVPAAVRLYDFEGTVFYGEARALISERVQLDRVRWRFHPQSLLRGRLAYRLRVDTVAGSVRGRVGTSVTRALVAEELEGIVNLRDLMILLGEDEPKGTGWMIPAIAEIRRDTDGRVGVWGSVELNDLVWTEGMRVELGGLVMEMEGDGPPWTVVLRDNGGPVRVTGELELDPAGGYRLSGMLTAREDSSPEVEQVLEMVSTGDSEGRHSIEIQGSF